jgi:hypothetical protein
MNKTCFAALYELHQNHTKDGGVFPSSRYKSSIRDPKKWWLVALEEAKVKGFRWHDLRHTFISRLVMKGVDLRTRMNGRKQIVNPKALYSAFKDSTGSKRAARAAGTVPKAIPIAPEKTSATTAEIQEVCSFRLL